ncbi:MAG: protein adenylyltransferase SelO family protein, partial [Candidatus Thioglobus sp.]|nr:protein adenylyltransferase SelO family protein [Candidatus Thioglobus sp.]
MISSPKFADLGEDYFSRVDTQKLKNSHLIHVNKDLQANLKLNLTEEELLAICSGEKKIDEVDPISSVYAGHQFGYFVPQLGDGRSCLIGELNGYELSLKGAGTTPFSRGADGRA